MPCWLWLACASIAVDVCARICADLSLPTSIIAIRGCKAALPAQVPHGLVSLLYEELLQLLDLLVVQFSRDKPISGIPHHSKGFIDRPYVRSTMLPAQMTWFMLLMCVPRSAKSLMLGQR